MRTKMPRCEQWGERSSHRPDKIRHGCPDITLSDHGQSCFLDGHFVDGNKRVAFQAMYVFLGLNGLRIDAAEEEVVELILALARGDLDEENLATWLREQVSAR